MDNLRLWMTSCPLADFSSMDMVDRSHGSESFQTSNQNVPCAEPAVEVGTGGAAVVDVEIVEDADIVADVAAVVGIVVAGTEVAAGFEVVARFEFFFILMHLQGLRQLLRLSICWI